MASAILQVTAHYRHHGDVKQVTDASAAEMCVRETDYCRVAVMISGTPVPLLRDTGRSELHHAERHVRSHEHVSVPARSDLRIYEVSVTFRSGASCQKQCRK